jgi:hypothetical protein
MKRAIGDMSRLRFESDRRGLAMKRAIVDGFRDMSHLRFADPTAESCG